MNTHPKGDNMLDLKSVSVLENIRRSCRVSIEQLSRMVERNVEKHQWDTYECYLVKEKKPGKSYRMFSNLTNGGIPGLLISRSYPQRVRRNHKLDRAHMLWLSRSRVENTINPDNLQTLGNTVSEFVQRNGESVVLLDGLEYLIIQTSFEKALKCLIELRNIAFVNGSCLIVSVGRDTLSQEEYNILRKSCAE